MVHQLEVERVVGRVRDRLVRGDAVVEAVQPRREDVALLVGEELLDGVGLLDVGHQPVTDARPRRIRVAAEHQLTAAGVDLQQLRAIGVAAERRVDHQPAVDLMTSVDDPGLAAEHLAQDLLNRLRRIPAHRRARAGLLRRPDLSPGDRIDRVDRADVPGVEVDRVVQEEIDLLELLLLDVDHRVRELAELARVVPVGVTQHDPDDLVGIETDGVHLVANALPAAGRVPVEDVRQLLPAAVVQRQVAVRDPR